jgi:ABC-type protease/lipase transport system fused ATPase/permease subunit
VSDTVLAASSTAKVFYVCLIVAVFVVLVFRFDIVRALMRLAETLWVRLRETRRRRRERSQLP